VLVLPEQITHAQASACLRQLVQGMPSQNGPAVVVEAGQLHQFDSSALAVLLEFRRLSLAQGKGFELRNLSGRLTDLARLYGVDGLLLGA
jgi:phospholipid transport system transporter-binding protein